MRRGTASLNWDDLQFVIRVARAGSFAKAAESLETNTSTVARRIHRLEQALETKILDRHSHGMQLTPSGKLLYQKAREVEFLVQDINTQLIGSDSGPKGTIRIAASEGVASLWLTPRIVEFLNRFPAIDIEIITNVEKVDLLSREVDIAIMLERPANNRLVVTKVASHALSFFSSKDYLKRRGSPTSPDDLIGHDFIDYFPHRKSPLMVELLDRAARGGRIRLVTNSAPVYVEALRKGMGIGLMPNFHKAATPGLIDLGIELPGRQNIWLVSHQETNKAKRVRLMLNFLKKEFEKDSSEQP